MSDQKCIYRYLSGEVCGLPKRDWRHDTTAVSHIFQPPLSTGPHLFTLLSLWTKRALCTLFGHRDLHDDPGGYFGEPYSYCDFCETDLK